MNLIQQLQASPKWAEFEEWYNNYIEKADEKYEIRQLVYLAPIDSENINEVGYNNTYGVNFCFLPPQFQKGVFEKFISESNLDITVDGYIGHETYGISGATFAQWKWFNSFEELLIWYFNN